MLRLGVTKKPDAARPGVVYGVADAAEPYRIRYVGRTISNLDSRFRDHWHQARSRRKKGPFQRWLLKRTPSDVLVFVLSRHPDVESVNQAEIDTIAIYRSLGQADLNLTDGGEGGRGHASNPQWLEAVRKSAMQRRGENCYSSSLTNAEVEEIRDYRSKVYEPSESLGRRYGVTGNTVTAVLRNQTYFNPGFDPLKILNDQTADNARNKKLTAKLVQEIRDFRRFNYMSLPKLADKYGVTVTCIHRMLQNKTWFDGAYDPSSLKKRSER